MSVGFIMYEIVDKDSLKNQGINTRSVSPLRSIRLDIHLNIKVLTPNRNQSNASRSWIFT